MEHAGKDASDDAGGRDGSAGAMPGTGGSGGMNGDVLDASDDGARPDAAEPDAAAPRACAPRTVAGDAAMHFHHVHFNTTDPEADLAFFEIFFDATREPFCEDEEGDPLTYATRTERAWFLYTKVAAAPDPALNTYLEHVGWVNNMPVSELMRMLELGITLYPEGRYQCPEAASGIAPCAIPGLGPYYFYVQAPSGARVEVALGPGPATSGFGHVHFIQGEDLMFFETISGGAYDGMAIDLVNHINASLTEDLLAEETVVDTRGKPIDHIAYSTTDLEAAKARIEVAGIEIAEDITDKPEYGFRSFFVRTAKGTWLEIVEDSPFAP